MTVTMPKNNSHSNNRNLHVFCLFCLMICLMTAPTTMAAKRTREMHKRNRLNPARQEAKSVDDAPGHRVGPHPAKKYAQQFRSSHSSKRRYEYDPSFTSPDNSPNYKKNKEICGQLALSCTLEDTEEAAIPACLVVKDKGTTAAAAAATPAMESTCILVSKSFDILSENRYNYCGCCDPLDEPIVTAGFCQEQNVATKNQ